MAYKYLDIERTGVIYAYLLSDEDEGGVPTRGQRRQGQRADS